MFRCDGHNTSKILKIFNIKNKNKPKFIIADTTKGKGVSFMENNNLWHYKNPDENQLTRAIKEIEKKYA